MSSYFLRAAHLQRRQHHQNIPCLSIIVLLLVCASARAETPSFNCANAFYPDERAICSNDELSSLDNLANAGYIYVRRVYGRQYANAIDLPLLQARRSCGDRVPCIKAYQLTAIQKFQSLGAPIRVLPQPAYNGLASTQQQAKPAPQGALIQTPLIQTPQPAEGNAATESHETSKEQQTKSTPEVFRPNDEHVTDFNSKLADPDSTPSKGEGSPVIAAVTAAAPQPGAIPDLEKRFLAAIEHGRSVYKSGANDMAKGAARPLRAKEICGLLTSVSVRNWVGRISKLSTNGDGKGVLAVQIGDDVYVQTWNNDVSDVVDHTLIDPASALFAKASALSEGQQVLFSGSFQHSDTDCVEESSLTMDGSLTEPAFIVRFFDIAPNK